MPPIEDSGALSSADAAGMIIGGKAPPAKESAREPEENSSASDDLPEDDIAPQDEISDDYDDYDDGVDEDESFDDDETEEYTDDTDDDDVDPSIAPPMSYTKAEKEAFASLPREHQETIAARERERRTRRQFRPT